MDALAIGLTVEAFLSLTPRETALTFEAAAKRMERERQRDAWLAWHVAALVRAKRFPPLKRVLGLDKARPLEGEELERRRREHQEIVERMTRSRHRGE